MSSNFVWIKSYGDTKNCSGHSDKVAITVIHVTCTGSFDVHSTVLSRSFRELSRRLTKNKDFYQKTQGILPNTP